MSGHQLARARTPRPWLMLIVMVVGQAATTIVTATPAFLIPHFITREGMTLTEAGLVAGAPSFGLVLTLIAWGALTDRYGERKVLLAGLSLTVVAVALSTLARGPLFLAGALVLSGGMSASINNASGRLIAGWFPAERRGLAMGIRQTCQPIGTAVAALTIPSIATASGVTAAIVFGGVCTLVSLIACALVVVDPKLPPKMQAAEASNPYRGSTVLARIHAVSILLVVPQFVLATFGLVWFTIGFGWNEVAAGALIAGAQFLGAAGRIGAGVWSDRVGSRMQPVRLIAVAGVILLLASAAFGWLDWQIPAAVAYVVASCVSVADNGLSFTAVAEIAGPGWAGRALGTQNTGQFLGSTVVPPIIGGLIGAIGIPGAFAVVAVTPLAAAFLVPSDRSVFDATNRDGEGAVR